MGRPLNKEDLCWDTVVISGRKYNEYPVSKQIIQNILAIRDKVASVNVFHNETPTREVIQRIKSYR